MSNHNQPSKQPHRRHSNTSEAAIERKRNDPASHGTRRPRTQHTPASAESSRRPRTPEAIRISAQTITCVPCDRTFRRPEDLEKHDFKHHKDDFMRYGHSPPRKNDPPTPERLKMARDKWRKMIDSLAYGSSPEESGRDSPLRSRAASIRQPPLSRVQSSTQQVDQMSSSSELEFKFEKEFGPRLGGGRGKGRRNDG